MKRATVLLTLALTLPAMAKNNVIERGEQLFAWCSACHSVTRDDEGRQGPSLAGIVGSRIGTRAGFPYTGVFIRLRDEGVVWTTDDLDAFLADPLAYAPGNAMDFFGMPDAGDRSALITYLETLSGESR